MTDVAALEADLAQVRLGDDPDRWALAAYRLAVAKSELATHADDLDAALALLERASRILTSARAPLEHSRILTAAASCHRAAGRHDRALDLFERAAELAAPRAGPAERAAALINVGLVHAEVGRPRAAVAALDDAVEILGAPADDEGARLLGAALVNRAQAHQAARDDAALGAAIADYEHALDVLPPDSPQAGMAAHGLGAALLERHARDRQAATLAAAMAAFDHSLAVFGPTSHPFQHAVARHSLALAYEQRAAPGDLARALNSAEASLTLFDPRLHRLQWRASAEVLGRLEQALCEAEGSRSRMDHLVALLARTDANERTALLRERLGRAATQPRARLDAELDALTAALVALPLEAYAEVLHDFVGVLMELPDDVLGAACAALCRAHRESGDPRTRDRVLDEVIHDTLFGPQRVRVRDLLEANGWVRP